MSKFNFHMIRTIASAMILSSAFVSNAHAERALGVNCVFETNEFHVIEVLRDMFNKAGAIEVKTLDEGVRRAYEFLSPKGMDKSMRPDDKVVGLMNTKIIRIEALMNNNKNVCVVIEGDVIFRGDYPSASKK